MKAKSLFSVLALSLLTHAAAQPQETPIPMTPALKQQIGQYAKQVSKRECSSKYEAFYVTPKITLTPAEFDNFFNAMLQLGQFAVAPRKDGSTVVGKLRRGESGYVYVNNAGSAADKLTIMSRQVISGTARIVFQGCFLK